MSEYDDIDHDRRKHSDPQEAHVFVGKWSAWVWIVPVLAVFFVGYLVVRYGFFGGGDVTVRFSEARGLDRYSPVRFRGAKVGTVQKISIDDDLKSVVVRISMDASMNHALRKGTRFWIVEPGLESGGIGSLLAGTYVAISPGEGEETREFVGQEYAPVLHPPEAGRTYVVEARGIGTMSIGAPVQFQGMKVGHVLGSQFDPRTGTSSIHVFVLQRFADFVRENTRFWRSAGLSFSLAGGGLSMGDSSLSSALSPSVAFYTPEVLAGPPAAQGSRFTLHASRAAAIASADGPHLTYLTYFPGSVQGLAPGTPVHIRGVQVGRVRDVRLRYLSGSASLETPVTLEIDPRQLEIPVTEGMTREQVRATMNDALSRMVRKGMRATLATSLVLPGASAVSLEFVAGAGSGNLDLAHEPPVIPAAASGSGLAGAMASINDVATTIRNLPLQEIASNIQSTTRRLDALVSDPTLTRSLRRLDAAMADVERITATIRQDVGPISDSIRNAATSAERTAKSIESTAETASQNVQPIVDSLRNAAASAESAAKRAEQLVGTSQRQNYDIAQLVRELTRAAEAVRALATYLNENPDALIKGRRE